MSVVISDDGNKTWAAKCVACGWKTKGYKRRTTARAKSVSHDLETRHGFPSLRRGRAE